MLVYDSDYVYVKQDWSSDPFRRRDLLPVSMSNLIPLLDQAGLTANPPAQADVYHLVETATMLANAQRFADVSEFCAGDRDIINSQVNLRSIVVALAEFARDFARYDTRYGNSLFAIRPDADPTVGMLNLYDSGDAAYDGVFGGLAVDTRGSDPGAVARVPTGDDLRAIYRDLDAMSRFIVGIGDGMSRVNLNEMFGKYNTDRSSGYPLLGPVFSAGDKSVHTNHYRTGDTWHETVMESQDFSSMINFRRSWTDGEVDGYDTYEFPEKTWIEINRTELPPATFVRLYRFASEPKLYVRYTVEGKSGGTTHPLKWGIYPMTTAGLTLGDHSFTFKYDVGSIENVIHEIYKLAVQQYHFQEGNGHFEVQMLDLLLDTGPMTLPTALPSSS